MKKYFLIFILMFTITSSYADDIFNNTMIGIGYDRVSFLPYDNSLPRFNSDNVNINVMLYGIYIDCSFSINGTNRYWYDGYYGDRYRYNRGPKSVTMDFGYAIPLISKDKPVRLFITPMVGFTNIRYDNCYYDERVYDRWDDYRFIDYSHFSYTQVNFGGAIGISINHLYIQGKATNTQFGGSIGYMF